MKAKRHSGLTLDEVNFDILLRCQRGKKGVTAGWMDQWMMILIGSLGKGEEAKTNKQN